MNEVLEKDSPLRAKIQPEANPAAQLVGAFVVLMATMETLAESSDMLENLEPELTKLQRALNRLRGCTPDITSHSHATTPARIA